MTAPLARNPYAAPRARTREAPRGERTAVYTPTQIVVGTFFGGVAAFIYFLRANFIALGRPEAARWTVLGGLVLYPLMLWSFSWLRLIGVISLLATGAIIASTIAERHQLTEEAITASEAYARHGNWRVFWITLACMVVSLAAAVTFVIAVYLLVT